MVVNKKAVANIGAGTVRNFSRYNSVTKNAIGRRIIEMAGEASRPDVKGVFGFDPEYGCGSVPIKVKWGDKFRHIIIIVIGGGVIIINISPTIPQPKPNPIADLKELKDAEFIDGKKHGNMRTIDMRKGGKTLGEIQIITDNLRVSETFGRTPSRRS